MKKLFYLSIIVICFGCQKSSQKNIYQEKRDNTVQCKNEIKNLIIDSVDIGSIAKVYSIGSYLLIADYKSSNFLIHIFNINNFDYIKSVFHMGQGPNEITTMGFIGIDKSEKSFFVSDHGKQCIFKFSIDSILLNTTYDFKKMKNINIKAFPDEYFFINDSLSIASIIEPTGNSGYNKCSAIWNINSDSIYKIDGGTPYLKKKRFNIAVSPERNTFVECYNHNDLMQIYDTGGHLKWNIYGPDWNDRNTNETVCFTKVLFCKDKIIASYSGKKNFSNDSYPRELFVFDYDGNYIKTLNVGYMISDFCYDKNNNRLIFILDDEIQFAYLSLDGIM